MKLGMAVVISRFERYLISKNVSPVTVSRYLREVRHFFELGCITDIRDVTRQTLYEYIVTLQDAQTRKRTPRFAPSVIAGMISTLRTLFRFLYRHEYIVTNPFDDAQITLSHTKQLRSDITVAEMNRFLSAIKSDTSLGLRDRTIFEMLYTTGLRVGEMVSLDMSDIDTQGRRLHVKKGKGSRERILPLASGILIWIERYMQESRAHFVERIQEKDETSALFVSTLGTRLSVAGVEARAKHYSTLVFGKEKRITPHIFRHSFASHLLMNGASVKDVSILLGHVSLDSTVGYTHFTVRSLKKIMKQYHPRENELYTETGRLEELGRIFRLTE